MIDHVSIAVRDLAASVKFYEPVLATLGYAKLIVRASTARLSAIAGREKARSPAREPVTPLRAVRRAARRTASR
jgi:hypothetical protein